MSGTYICHLCNRRWPWPREPITEFAVYCTDCEDSVLDFVADDEGNENERESKSSSD